MANVGHAVIGLAGNIESCDAQFAHITGSIAARLCKKTVHEITAPGDQAECERAFKRLVATGQPLSMTKRFVRENGAIFWAKSHASLVYDDDEPLRIIATVSELVAAKDARSPAMMLELARTLLEVRRDREEVCCPALVSESGWDIILMAYIAEAEGRCCTVSSISQGLELAASLSQRWITALSEGGGIEVEIRDTTPSSEKSFILTQPTHKRVESYLQRVSNALQTDGDVGQAFDAFDPAHTQR